MFVLDFRFLLLNYVNFVGIFFLKIVEDPKQRAQQVSHQFFGRDGILKELTYFFEFVFPEGDSLLRSYTLLALLAI